MTERVLVFGGYGVFGSRLCRRLAETGEAEILVAGRSLAKAERHCARYGGTPIALDRDGDIIAALKALEPTIVVDAAGPFQNYGDRRYRVARAALACGAHYLDLADDTDFVAGITELGEEARAAERHAISGASSVPAISAAAFDALTTELREVAVVSSVILPGNRAPRGISVVRAIASQVGRPLHVWRGGRPDTIAAWGTIKRQTVAAGGKPPITNRLSSPIGAPDLALFVERYGARSVAFDAGLELRWMHVALWVLGLFVRAGLIASLAPLAGLLKWTADRFENFGSDRGAMVVRARGRDHAGIAVERRWSLIAESGDGPEIPPTPALILVRKLLRHQMPAAPDARHAAGLLSLEEIEAGLSPFDIAFEREEEAAPPLMQRVLGERFDELPYPIRRLAEIHDIDYFAGVASVERGRSVMARIACAVFGFPPQSEATPLEVCKETTRAGETWTRSFAGRAFKSHLSSAGPGYIRERFGPFSFLIRLTVEGGAVYWPLESWRFLGLPMPRFMMPRSQTMERVDAEGRFTFDVDLALPVAGRIVRYRGWLRPAGAKVAGASASEAGV